MTAATAKDWVDFEAAKAAPIELSLRRLGFFDELTRDGEELKGWCPFHPDTGKKDSFSVNVAKGVFHCFACKKKGSALDLVSQREKISIKEAAARILEWRREEVQSVADWHSDWSKGASLPPLSFDLVLKHYGFLSRPGLRRNGDEWQGHCPCCQQPGFAADTAKGTFACSACRRGGDALDLVAQCGRLFGVMSREEATQAAESIQLGALGEAQAEQTSPERAKRREMHDAQLARLWAVPRDSHAKLFMCFEEARQLIEWEKAVPEDFIVIRASALLQEVIETTSLPMTATIKVMQQ